MFQQIDIRVCYQRYLITYEWRVSSRIILIIYSFIGVLVFLNWTMMLINLLKEQFIMMPIYEDKC